MTPRDEARLTGVHPILQQAVLYILAAADALEHPMFVVEGVRTAERQHTLWQQGRSQPGPVVTGNIDGYEVKGTHQIQEDGQGHAVDLAFVDDPRTPKDETWDQTMPWRVAGVVGEWLGLVWGGRWKLGDYGHFELKNKY